MSAGWSNSWFLREMETSCAFFALLEQRSTRSTLYLQERIPKCFEAIWHHISRLCTCFIYDGFCDGF